MDDAYLCEFVDHCIDLRGVSFGYLLVGRVADRADRVSCRLCIILVMLSVPFALANALLCRCVVCLCLFFYIW